MGIAMLSQSEFAQAVLAGLVQAGAWTIPRYDELSFCFVLNGAAAEASGKIGQMRLEPWFAEYQQAAAEGRGQQAIDNLVRHWVQSLGTDSSRSAPSDRPIDSSRIVPLIRSRFDFVLTALQGASAGQPRTAQAIELVWRVVADHLALVLAEDKTDSFQFVTQPQLAQAGLSFDAALPLALQNLQRLEPAFANPRPFAATPGQAWIPAVNSTRHNAAWLMGMDAIGALPLAGQPVAFVPFADSFAVTGSENHAELARLASMALSLLTTRSEKPITAIPLVLTGRQWLPWLPPTSHPLYWTIKELWCLHENSLYGDQGGLLKRKLETTANAPYVASYKMLASPGASGQRRIGTLTMWTETLNTLLPKADAVTLTKVLNRAELDAGRASEPQLGEKITISWQELASYLGDRLKAQGMYPERFLVNRRDFPAGPDWQRLGLAQVSVPAANAAQHAPSPSPVPVHSPMATPAPRGTYGSAPTWQPSTPLAKGPPVAPMRPHRRAVWPVLLAIAIPVCVVMLLLVGVTLFVFSRWTANRTTLGQRITTVQNANWSHPPPFEIKPPWSPVGEFPALGGPEAALPRLPFTKQDLLLTGRERHHFVDEFRDEAPEGGWLVGLRVVRGHSWGGAVRSLQPIYQVENEYRLGNRCGPDEGFAQAQVLAKPGYAVGRIDCRAGLVNNAVRLSFYRVKEDRLDLEDSYQTEWLGSPGGGVTPSIGGKGDPLVGITGSCQQDIIELQGILAAPLPKVEVPLPASAGTARDGAATDMRSGPDFPDKAPAGGWLVGLRIFQGESWGGAPLAIQPIYQVADRYLLGTRHGRDGGELHQWIAPPGYAVSEIWADQGLVVHRLQLKYQRVVDGRLDDAEPQQSPRLGPDGGRKFRLTSEGKPIIGLNVELGGDISGLGLIVAE